MFGTPRYCKLCRGGIVCDGRTEHHLSLQHVEIVMNYVVSTESLISKKVDLGNNGIIIVTFIYKSLKNNNFVVGTRFILQKTLWS
jgi:hypothetical protein